MSNLYAKFKRLLPDAPLQVGTVAAFSNGSATITLPGGGQIVARGQAAIGSKVFVRDGVIEGAAPSLPVVEIDV